MKLIITDLDNTLLRNDKSISEYTAKVFERIRAKGYLVAFATARGCAMSRFVETIKPDIIVSNGGATISVNGEVIYRNLLSEKDVETIITMCYEFTDGKALSRQSPCTGFYRRKSTKCSKAPASALSRSPCGSSGRSGLWTMRATNPRCFSPNSPK